MTITIPLWAFWSMVGIGAFESVVLIIMMTGART